MSQSDVFARKAIFIIVFTCLFKFQGGSLSWKFSPFVGLRKATDF